MLPLDRVWALARAWYHDRLTPEFRGDTDAAMELIFATAGLDGPFWRVSPTP